MTFQIYVPARRSFIVQMNAKRTGKREAVSDKLLTDFEIAYTIHVKWSCRPTVHSDPVLRQVRQSQCDGSYERLANSTTLYDMQKCVAAITCKN